MKHSWIRILVSALFLAGIVLTFSQDNHAQAGIPSVGASQAAQKIQPALLDMLSAGSVSDLQVFFVEQADLSPAYNMGWQERGWFVYNTLRQVADRSQANAKAILDALDVKYESYFTGNELYVYGGNLQIAMTLAGLPEVSAIEAPRTYYIDPLDRGANRLENITWAGDLLANMARMTVMPPILTGPDAITDWGILDTNADDFWAYFGLQGDGIVVANIDTGVQWNHPALDQSYRCPNNPTNPACWYDPSNTCGGSVCDNNGHGTHTMGTIVADDDPSLAYIAGMAPNATWIACKGCESSSCSTTSLNACADWLVAPGGNPDNRPHVVNNSWGGRTGTCDTWYLAKVQAWRAAGIFPAFSAGNSGSGCSTLGVPAVYQESFASAAHDSSRTIASFSSRGPAPTTAPCHPYTPYTKPNISAPGVNVCSSVPTNSWDCTYSGTSMASPHTAGAVALLWSCNPTLRGQIDQTFQILQDNAATPPAGNCSAPPTRGNYTYGYGYLDVYAAGLLWCGEVGYLEGTVTNTVNGNPIPGATVLAYPVLESLGNIEAVTDPNGYYSMTLMVGSYNVSAEHPQFVTTWVNNVQILTDTVTVQNIAMQPRGRLWGYVTDQDNGFPLDGATVTADDGTEATTNASGFYEMYLDPGAHLVTATLEPEYAPESAVVSIISGQDTRQDFTLLAAISVVPEPIHAYVEIEQTTTLNATMHNRLPESYTFTFLETGAAGPLAINTGEILLMGDDVNTAGWDAYRAALTAAGVTWDERNLDTQSFPTPADLAPYDVLIWFDEDVIAPGDAECQIVANWLQSGNKNLFITSVDFLWDLANGTPGNGEHNLYLLLQTNYLGDYAGTTITRLEGVPGDLIGGDFVPPNGLVLAGNADSNGDYANEATSLAEVGMLYGTGGSGSGHAGLTHYEGANYKTVWLGVNYHNGLTDPAQRNTLMANILGFFLGGDVPWFGTSIPGGTVPAGGSLGWTNYFTATSAVGIVQPGDYILTLRARPQAGSGQLTKDIDVVMTVLPSPNMGLLEGTVRSLGYCESNPAPLQNADIMIETSLGVTVSLSTGPNGHYHYYFYADQDPLTMTVTYPEHAVEVFSGIVIDPGMTTVVDVDMHWLRPCVQVWPESLAITLPLGVSETIPMSIANEGAVDLNFELFEIEGGYLPPAGGIRAGWPGPDGFGYLGSEVPFTWVEISGSGTPVPLGDDAFAGPFSMGFTFPFYGVNQTQFFISSNGFLSFGAGSTALTNQCPLPNSGAPNDIIPLMWDDLDPGDTGDLVYYQYFAQCPVGMGACMVVQYENYHHYPGGGAIAGTFEAILFQNGSILVQYEDAGAEEGAESTTGIENNNQPADYGLTYACNAPGSLHDGLAICYAYPGTGGCVAGDIPWLTEQPISGTVPVHGDQDIAVIFDTTALTQTGTYTGSILVASDDPFYPAKWVQVTLNVAVDYPPLASFESNTPVCLGETMVFTNTSDPGNPPAADFLWDFGDGVTSTLENPTHDYAAVGTYNVTLQVCNPIGCDTASAVVEVLALPEAGFTYATDWLTVVFTNTSLNANAYLWDFGDGDTSALENPIHNYAAAGTYTVTLTAYGPCGVDMVEAAVTVFEQPLQDADLSLSKVDDPDPVYVGEMLTYTLTVINHGPLTATNVLLTDTLPAGVTFVSATAPCVETDGVVTCALGDLGNGESVEIVIVVLAPDAEGVITNAAEVTSETSDPEPGNNLASVETTVAAPPVLEYFIYLPTIQKN